MARIAKLYLPYKIFESWGQKYGFTVEVPHFWNDRKLLLCQSEKWLNQEFIQLLLSVLILFLPNLYELIRKSVKSCKIAEIGKLCLTWDSMGE